MKKFRKFIKQFEKMLDSGDSLFLYEKLAMYNSGSDDERTMENITSMIDVLARMETELHRTINELEQI